MRQAEEVLVVEVFQLREVILGLQVPGEVVVTAGVVELVAVLRAAGDRQACAVRRGAPYRVLQHTAGQRQAIDVVRGDLRAGKRLRQHTGIVRQKDR
ncbi:hypothetical protein D3C87_1247910 [compost metagenome]